MRHFQMDRLCAFPALHMRGMLKLTVTLSHTEMLISHLWQKTESLLTPCLHPSISANIQPCTYRRLHVYSLTWAHIHLKSFTIILFMTNLRQMHLLKACLPIIWKGLILSGQSNNWKICSTTRIRTINNKYESTLLLILIITYILISIIYKMKWMNL